MDEMDLTGAELYADGSRGVYIPQHFAESVQRDKVANVTPEDWAALEAGPDHEHYWDVWTHVLDNAEIIDPAGRQVWTLHQDGDLWVVPTK